MKFKAVFLAVGVLAAFSVAGCSEKTEEAAETAVEGAGQDTQRNVEGAGAAVAEGAQKTGEAVGNAVEGAAKETQDAVQVMAWTAKVKSALAADEKIAAYKLNVDSSGEKDHVTITGTAPTQAEKDRITMVAKKVLGANATVTNNVTVSKM